MQELNNYPLSTDYKLIRVRCKDIYKPEFWIRITLNN